MLDGTDRKRVYTRLTALVGACFLALACVPTLTDTKPREANKVMPQDFGAASRTPKTSGPGATPNTGVQSAAKRSWREFFPDPQLASLIDVALKNNQELNAQLQEMLIAKYEIMAAKGEYMPKVSAGVGAGIDKVSEYSSQGVSDEAHDVANPLQDYRLGFSASWEVDIWQRLRNSAKAAAMRYMATVEGRNLVITGLVDEIASAYYELIALDNQLEVLKSNIEIQQNALEVVKIEKAAARVTQLAVQRFEAEVLKNQSKRFKLEQQIIETENRVNFLVGRYPQPVARNSRQLSAPLPALVETGIPSHLLENRPDVRRAERELEAAKLDVEVAKARFYPAFSIEAGVGYQAFNAKHLVATPESLVANLAGNLTAPLINRQAIKAEYFAANAGQLRAVFNYEQTVLKAFTEVANQIALVDNLRQTYEFEAKQVEMLNQSIAVSNILFQSARADYMEVLLTRRDALESQMDLIETKLKQRLAVVNIYHALGGGWR
jgi:outer membrane protein, multidrug efflux system